MQQLKREAAKEIQKKNLHPHRMSRGGYDGLVEKLKSLDPSSYITEFKRHVKWKKARQLPNGDFITEMTRLIAERIVSNIIIIIIYLFIYIDDILTYINCV